MLKSCWRQAVSPCSHLGVSCSVLTKQLSERKFSTLSSVLVDNLLAVVGTSKATSTPHSLQGFGFLIQNWSFHYLPSGQTLDCQPLQTSDEHLDQDIYDRHT